jgi:hypothetical protein
VGRIANATSPLKIPAPPLPFKEGWAARPFALDGVIGGDGEWEIGGDGEREIGGTQVLGDPSSASRKRATMKIVVCFRIFPFLSASKHPHEMTGTEDNE